MFPYAVGQFCYDTISIHLRKHLITLLTSWQSLPSTAPLGNPATHVSGSVSPAAIEVLDRMLLKYWAEVLKREALHMHWSSSSRNDICDAART